MPVVRTERIFAYGASILTLTAFDPLRSLPAPSYTHAYGIRPVSVNIYARTRIVQYINIYTSDNAECQVDVEKFGSERTERKSDTEQKTTSHSNRSTAKLVAQFTSYWSCNSTVTHTYKQSSKPQ